MGEDFDEWRQGRMTGGSGRDNDDKSSNKGSTGKTGSKTDS